MFQKGLSFLLSFIFVSFLGAQSLTGIWRGSFYNEYEMMMTGARYRYEVQINDVKQALSGVTYSYQDTRFYGKASLHGRFTPTEKALTIVENKMLEIKMSDGGEGCLMTCYLTYRKEGNTEVLEGRYSSISMNDKNKSCGGGVVRLEKVTDSDFKKEDFLLKKTPASPNQKTKPGQDEYLIAQKPVKKPNDNSKPLPKPAVPKSKSIPPVAKNQSPAPKTIPAAPKKVETIVKAEPKSATAPATNPKKTRPIDPPKATKNRSNELVETITTGAKKLEISFYDNGEIDGDIISVYANQKLVVNSQKLTTQPITISVDLDEENAEQDIVMVAENLGSIPPNTSLMIVQAGSQRYTVRLTSTEQKNAMVRFKYDPSALK